MKSFETRITIKATAEKIWRILTDGPGYASWNTTYHKLEGNIALGEKLALHVKISPRVFKVKVAELVPNQKMVWADGMPFGLFKGERTYTLTPKGDGTVEFFMIEVFSGLMSPLIVKSIPDMGPAFAEFAACLKKQAEQP
jgi:hypothetical protein